MGVPKKVKILVAFVIITQPGGYERGIPDDSGRRIAARLNGEQIYVSWFFFIPFFFFSKDI